MHLIHQVHEIEYRDAAGQDWCAQADLWADGGRTRAVVVLRGLTPWGELAEHGQAAAHALLHGWLPYLLRPDARLLVLALRPAREGKARALVLPG